MENGVKEFWYFVRSEVKKLATVEPGERQKYADALLQDLGHQERCETKELKAKVWTQLLVQCYCFIFAASYIVDDMTEDIKYISEIYRIFKQRKQS